MDSFLESTTDGLALVIDERGERIPLHEDMRVNFSDLAGATVWVEHRRGRITCSAKVPESNEPLTWHFKVVGPTVQNTRAPVPLPAGSTLKSAIEIARVRCNGRW